MATADLVDEAQLPGEPRRSEPEVNKLFRMVMKHEGSDLHLKVSLPPMMRLRGEIRQMQMPPLTQDDMERLLFPIMNDRQHKQLEDYGGDDFTHGRGQAGCPFC